VKLDWPSNRVVFSEIDQACAASEDAFGPFNGETAVATGRRLELDRLHGAVVRASRRHFLCGMRRARGSVLGPRDFWVPAELGHPRIAVCEGAGDDTRDEFLGEFIATDREPGFRLLLSRRADGDLLTLSTSHIASDGLGALLLLRTIADEYAGRPHDGIAVDYATARRVLASLSAASPELRRRRWRAMGALSREVWPGATTHVAPSAGARGSGSGVVHHRFPWAVERRDPHGPTVNDVLLVALLRAIEEHNVARGVPCGRMSILVPLNLRPAHWDGPMGNFSVVSLVVSHPRDRLEPRSFLAAITAQSRRLRADRATAGMLGLMRASASLPLFAQDTLTRAAYAWEPLTPTAILSNLGRIGNVPSFGDEANALWVSPPCRAPCALGVGVAFHAGHIHLGLRYRREVLEARDVERMARRMTVEAMALTRFR
jgi:NRPS condensation-like uncharacterized protein